MNNNTAVNAIKGTLNRAMGVVKGVSDLEYFYAGRTHFIELKSKDSIQSEDQKLFQARVEAHRYHIVRSYDEFRQLITAIHAHTQ